MKNKIKQLPQPFIDKRDGLKYYQFVIGEVACIFKVSTDYEAVFKVCTWEDFFNSPKVLWFSSWNFGLVMNKFNELEEL